MGLFVNKPQINTLKPLYTLSLNKTVLIVGLGNPGKEYSATRHNIGFDCLDDFVAKRNEFDNWQEKKNLKSVFNIAQFGETRVIVIKPSTFMNLSGEAISAVSNFYNLTPTQMLVIHDELDINFGVLRLSVGGSSAGHNGVQSIIDSMGDKFGRVRVGIGPKTPSQIDSADFVLQKFSDKEQAEMPELYKEVGSIITEFIYSSQINPETRTYLI